jgi:hypothetical protein
VVVEGVGAELAVGALVLAFVGLALGAIVGFSVVVVGTLLLVEGAKLGAMEG